MGMVNIEEVLSTAKNDVHTRVTGVDSGQVQEIKETVDGITNLDYAVTETSDGLGIEVWDTEYRKI